MTVDEVRNDAQAAFGKVPARELVARAANAEPPRLSETRLAVSRPDVKVPLFMRVYRVPSYAEGAPGQAEALETLAQMMGGDDTGTLYRKLVVERRLATNAGASYDGYARDAGEFTVYAYPRSGVSLAVLERAIDGIIADYAKAAPDRARACRAPRRSLSPARPTGATANTRWHRLTVRRSRSDSPHSTCAHGRTASRA